MLSDFYDLKKDLNIVNKSYVTIGKSLKLNGVFVSVRDTMLLAPAGCGSLDKIGELYKKDGDFSKRFLSSVDKSRMSEFLKRDKKAFEEYAIQDALITLKHGVAMENFNLSIKKFGIPLTLSSIGRNYVFY